MMEQVLAEGKVYQVKEVMDKFGISRDTIYHYEKCGLVSMRREENGYRVFDELNVQKIKKILDLRDLGLSIDEIKEFCACNSMEKRVDIMLKQQKQIEEEIQKLKKRQLRILAQQKHLSDSTNGKCGRKRNSFHYVFRGRVIYENQEQFQKAIHDAYKLAQEMGYKLQQTIYVTKQAPMIEGKERLSYTVMIPMEM